MIEEITAQELDPERFIAERVNEIRAAVGGETAINALSGGVDSSTVTLLGHRALDKRLRTVFIENGLMRQGEPAQVVDLFRKLGVSVEVIDALCSEDARPAYYAVNLIPLLDEQL